MAAMVSYSKAANQNQTKPHFTKCKGTLDLWYCENWGDKMLPWDSVEPAMRCSSLRWSRCWWIWPKPDHTFQHNWHTELYWAILSHLQSLPYNQLPQATLGGALQPSPVFHPAAPRSPVDVLRGSSEPAPAPRWLQSSAHPTLPFSWLLYLGVYGILIRGGSTWFNMVQHSGLMVDWQQVMRHTQ